jgi:hypothetical protein
MGARLGWIFCAGVPKAVWGGLWGEAGEWRCSQSISTGGPKTPPKTRPARKLGSGQKTGLHRHPQNCAGAWACPINEPALPWWLLCGRILSGAPAPHDSANLTPEAPLPATPPFPAGLSRQKLPVAFSRRCFLLRSWLPVGRQL